MAAGQNKKKSRMGHCSIYVGCVHYYVSKSIPNVSMTNVPFMTNSFITRVPFITTYIIANGFMTMLL